MTPIDPAELSALLDGELSAERAAVVRQALADDPALRAEYEAMLRCDTAWKAAAATARFTPQVSLHQSLWGYRLRAAGVVSGLLLLRIALKVMPSALAVPIETVLLTVLLVWGVRRLLVASEAERWRLVQQAAGQVG